MFKESAIANLIFLPAVVAIGLLMAFLLFGATENPTGYATAALAFFVIGFASFAEITSPVVWFIEDVDPLEMGISNRLPINGNWAGYSDGVAGRSEVQLMRDIKAQQPAPADRR